jgi:FlaA1/EpsC-like NDP-sugar epimerase
VRGAATHLVIALPSLRGSERKGIVELAASTGLPVPTVPLADELQSCAQVNRILDIEPEDLLGRKPVQRDEASIGDCLCRQVARYSPARLVLHEPSEFDLYPV